MRAYGGSSPHTRGTYHISTWTGPRLRFIPAHAGNISPSAKPTIRMTVHPRTRGEHPTCPGSNGRTVGSSPHTRGTFDNGLGARFPGRFIPAHAGNIPVTDCHLSKNTVHPRTRGEHTNPTRNDQLLTGSSPHTRGTYNSWLYKRTPLRFIPAHAGNMMAFAVPT